MEKMKFDTTRIVTKFEELFNDFLEYIGFVDGELNLSLYRSESNELYVDKYAKNISTHDKLKSLRSRFYTIIFFCEYFTKNLEIKYTGEYDMREGYIDYIFTSQLTDSLRSILDIYSIFTMNLIRNTDLNNINFSWKKFIKPIEQYSKVIYEHSNNLYKKYDSSSVKKIRDTDRHLGFNRINLDHVMVNKEIVSYKFHKIEYPECLQVVTETLELIDDFISLLEITIGELCKSKKKKIEN